MLFNNVKDMKKRNMEELPQLKEARDIITKCNSLKKIFFKM